MKQIIDPHLHFFELDQGQYQWLKEDQAPFWPDKFKLRHKFHEGSLTLNAETQLKGFVHIEAGFDNAQPWREIEWLESSCTIGFSSVAGIDLSLEESTFIEQIERLLQHASVVGCRHILDEEASTLLNQPRVQHNLAYLAHKQLSFDLQMPLSNNAAVAQLVTLLHSQPDLRIIINHAGWPPLDTNKGSTSWSNWCKGLEALAQFSQCAVKCSGWEMADRQYDEQWQLKVISSCLEIFRDQRVMLASNFPLALFTQGYDELWQNYFKLDAKINVNEKQLTALTYANAAYWYKFKL